ncbi:hypothetical protein ACSSS7_001021 [Eimeria intestinalis]
MAGRTLPRLTPQEFEPGLLDAGGLPVRVRHIFDRYRQGAGLEETTGHASVEGAPRTTSRPAGNWSPNETVGRASPAPSQAASSPLLGRRLQGKSSLQGAAHLPSSLLFQQQQQRSLSSRVKAVSAGAAEYGVDMDGVGDDSPVSLLDEGASLLVESYTGVVQSGQEQEFALVLLTRSLPVASLIVYVGSHAALCFPLLLWFLHHHADGDIRAKSFLVGRTLRATLPPLVPGRHSIAVGDTSGNTYRIQLGVSSQLGSRPPGPETEVIPLIALPYPARGVESGAASPLPEGPFTAAELEAFVAKTQKQLAACGGPSTQKTLVPFCSRPSREGAEGDSVLSFEERIKKCLQMAYGQRGPILRPADGVPPFDCITIFAFTLMPSDSEDRGVSPQPSLNRVACLDRFEVSERLCADTRHWKHTDTCIPAKNTEAATYTFGTGSAEQCPVPQCLRRAKNPFKDYPEGIEIGPYVYLYFEPWPAEVLPMPHPEPPASSSSSSSGGGVRAKDSSGGAASIQPASSAEGGGTAREGPPAQASGDEGGPYFSVTLCVGKYIFTSIIGVHVKVVSAIFNEWLTQVPLKKGGAEQLVRLKLKDLAPITASDTAASSSGGDKLQ